MRRQGLTVALVCLGAAAGIVLLGIPRWKAGQAGGTGTSEWVKYEENPVLGGALGSCFDPWVLKEGRTFRMWFSWRPRHAIALVESQDGVHWTPPQVVLTPGAPGSWEGEDVNRASVVRRPDGYHMWYTGQAGGRSAIGYATSEDGVHWHRVGPSPVLTPEEPWEKVATMCPDVLWEARLGLYRMWYSAGDQYEPDAIGLAESRDGVHWIRHEQPVFTADPSSPWDSFKVTGAQVIRQASWYVMFYIGFQDVDHAQIGLARSADGVSGWVRHPHNPIIPRGPDGAWDEDAVYKPAAVLLENGRWLLWYNARQGSLEQIGLATHEGGNLGFESPARR